MAASDTMQSYHSSGERFLSHPSPVQLEGGDKVRAGLIASLVLPVVFIGFSFISGYGPLDHFEWVGVLFGFVMIYGFSLACFVVFGLPAIAILRSTGHLRIWTLMIAGVGEGALLGCLFYFLILQIDVGSAHGKTSVPPEFDMYGLLYGAGIFGLTGFLVAAVYGVVAKVSYR